MPITIPESDAQVEAQIRAWVAKGNEVKQVKTGRGRRRARPYVFSLDDAPLIEEPRRGGSGRK